MLQIHFELLELLTEIPQIIIASTQESANLLQLHLRDGFGASLNGLLAHLISLFTPHVRLKISQKAKPWDQVVADHKIVVLELKILRTRLIDIATARGKGGHETEKEFDGYIHFKRATRGRYCGTFGRRMGVE
jgi:hypothetical protein